MSIGMLFLKVRHLASRVAIFVGSTASGFMYFMTVTHIQLLRLQDGLEDARMCGIQCVEC